MGNLRAFLEGVSEGFFGVMRCAGLHGANDLGRIDRLCRELGWKIDGREGDKIMLNFHNSHGGLRQIVILGGDADLVLFVVYSEALLTYLPDEVMGYMLRQNDSIPLGAWAMAIIKEKPLLFVQYRALGSGLTKEVLHLVCESLVAEAVEFDDKLKKAGLL